MAIVGGGVSIVLGETVSMSQSCEQSFRGLHSTALKKPSPPATMTRNIIHDAIARNGVFMQSDVFCNPGIGLDEGYHCSLLSFVVSIIHHCGGDRQVLPLSSSLAGFASYPNRLICVHRLPVVLFLW